MKKLTLFLVAMLFSTLSFAAQPKRIYAYGLSATLNGNVYTFSFSANETPTSGRMLFYDATTSELVGEIALTSPVLGVNNVQISVDELPGIHNQQLNWAVELSAAKVTAYEKIYADASHKYRRGHSNVDVSPESDHFGAVYVGDRVKTTANGKFYVYSPTYAIKDANGYSLGSSAWGFSRFDVAPDGKVWLSDFSDAHSGLWIVDPSDLTTATQFFVGDRQTSGLIKNGDVETGSSLSCATLYGKGANTKLITVGEDYKNYSFPVTVFNIGQTDGSLATSWSTAPNKMFNTLGNAAQNFEAKACEKGVWVSTNRGTGANNSSATSLRFYTWDGACTWSSHEHTDVINGNLGAGFEITPDEKQLIMKVADKIITIFDITWDGSTPTLTKKTSFDCGFAAVSTINLDYAGNIVTVAGTAWGSTDDKRMSLVVYSNPTDNNTCEVPAKKASVVTKKVLHTLTSFSNDEAKGTVSGAGTYIEGTTATLTATPATGYKLLYWSDRSTTNPRTITMNKNEAISAYFVKVYDQEPTFTITKVWENTNVPATTGDGFQAVGWDGNIYMQNKTAGKIQVFSNGTNAATDYATSNTSGQQIAVDEAGNMIVFNAYFATGTPNAIQIFKKGSTTAKAVTFTLKDPARCDFFSASGDIYSASGGYVYFYCAGRTVINRLKITNGAATAADVTTDVVGEAVYSSPQNTNYVMVDIFGNLVAHARSNAINAINVYTNESKAFTLPSIKMGTLGGCSFELGGKELWAYHAGASNYSSEWNIYNMTDSKFLSDDDFYAVDKEATTNYACNWLNVQVVDEYTAYIYQFCPKKAVALWKVTMQAGKATYTVTANATNGSVTGAGTYEEGATATLTATPAEHYRFVNWTYDSETSTDNPLSLVVNSDITVTANFEPVQYTLIAPTNDENKGTVTGAGTYAHGTEVTLTANPAAGYKLLYWSDRSKENPRNITMTKNEALSAYFVKKYDVEPTFSIQKVWENTNVPDVNTNGYQAVGWDRKVYLQASADSKIMVYNGTSAATEYATSGAGYQIAVDEVGNMIVYNGWFGAANPNNILIYAKGSTTGKEVTFTLPNPGRCDFFSASGNIYSEEGGYVYFYCNTTKVVNRLKIKNGAATDADVTTDIVGGSLVDGCTQNHVIKDIFGNLVAHSRLNGIRALNVVTNEVTNFYTLPNLKTNTLGGCSFELSGKEFWAYNMGTTAYTSEWNLYNVTDGQYISAETLCAKDKTTTNNNKAANWLNVQVIDEKTAYIYQYCPTVAVAVWKVTRDHIVSATAENGTVEGAGTYKDNATATLTATPNDGYLFKNWTTKNGAVVSTDNPYSFTVTEDVELVANFDGPFCELILNTNDEEKGTVSGAGFYTQGQTVTIKATPKAGYKLLYWSDRSTQTTRTITMNKKEALSAYFVKVYDEEPTFAIEKVWENTNVPASANNGFQAVGWDQKIYMKDRLGAAINVYTATGSELYVNTDAFTSEDALKGDQPIAIDDAGNIIIRSGSGLFYSAPKQVTIYKNGDKTGKVIDFTLPATGRCDFISASGDIYSAEGGYVYFYCQNQTTVSRLYIKNGGASAADISVDEVGVNLTAGSSQSHVFTNIFGDLMTHTRDNNHKVLQEVNVATGAAITMDLPNFKKSTLGGCSFELGGKEFIAYNIAGTDYNSEWNLYNMTDGEFLSDETLYAKDRTSKKTSGAANWLNVQVVDEKTAYIYQFCPEVAVAVWKVTLVETVVIDDKADNTAALAEYEGQVVNATVTRAFDNKSLKTLTLPFDMDEEQIKAVFGETAIVHEFTSVGEENDMFYLHFDPTTTIEAGKPYIIQLPETGDYDAKDGFTIEKVTIKTDLHSVKPTAGAITMQPVLDGGGRLTQASEYWLASDNYLYSAGAHPTALLGLRAYFINSTGRPIRARVVCGENEATSIPTVVAPENNVRKVMKDGQIIIIRGEKQYNIQGQVIE